MLVGERMTRRVITVRPDMPVQEALNKMKREKVRRFPVIEASGKLVGIVSEKDLLNAQPSEATTLSIWEIGYLLSKITVERVMTRNIITVTEDTPLEEAARIMADNKIGSLPVVRGNDLVGIITETDLFKIFIELLGGRNPGVRLSALVRNEPGKLHQITGSILELGGNIVALGTFSGDSPQTMMITLKVDGIELDALRKAVEPFVERIQDIRASTFA